MPRTQGLGHNVWVVILALSLLWLGAWGPTPNMRPPFLPPLVPLTATELAVFEASRGVEPDLFGEPLQQLALLQDHDARLAAMWSKGDLGLVGITAFAWSMRPDDVRQRQAVFVEVVDEAEVLLDQIALSLSRGEEVTRIQYKRLSMRVLVCKNLAVLDDSGLTSLTPRLNQLGCGLIDRCNGNQHLFEGAIFLLYELELRGDVNQRGAELLRETRDADDGFDIQMNNWHAQTMEEFMGVASTE